MCLNPKMNQWFAEDTRLLFWDLLDIVCWRSDIFDPDLPIKREKERKINELIKIRCLTPVIEGGLTPVIQYRIVSIINHNTPNSNGRMEIFANRPEICLQMSSSSNPWSIRKDLETHCSNCWLKKTRTRGLSRIYRRNTLWSDQIYRQGLADHYWRSDAYLVFTWNITMKGLAIFSNHPSGTCSLDWRRTQRPLSVCISIAHLRNSFLDGNSCATNFARNSLGKTRWTVLRDRPWSCMIGKTHEEKVSHKTQGKSSSRFRAEPFSRELLRKPW